MKTLIAFCMVLCLTAVTGCGEESTPAEKPGKPTKVSREVLDFTATWCGPCRRNEPTIARMERGGIKVKRVDVDENPSLAAKYGITSVPTYVILENGKEVRRTQSISELWGLRTWLNKNFKDRRPTPNPDMERPINAPLQVTPRFNDAWTQPSFTVPRL